MSKVHKPTPIFSIIYLQLMLSIPLQKIAWYQRIIFLIMHTYCKVLPPHKNLINKWTLLQQYKLKRLNYIICIFDWYFDRNGSLKAESVSWQKILRGIWVTPRMELHLELGVVKLYCFLVLFDMKSICCYSRVNRPWNFYRCKRLSNRSSNVK